MKWRPTDAFKLNHSSLLIVFKKYVFTAECEVVCRKSLHSIYRAFLNSLDDYTVDRRGDIGAWVREAALTALKVTYMALLYTLM